MKASKAQADYGEGQPNEHCGICTFFRDGACTITEGLILPRMWCRFFRRNWSRAA